jgi:hypothetical protein
MARRPHANQRSADDQPTTSPPPTARRQALQLKQLARDADSAALLHHPARRQARPDDLTTWTAPNTTESVPNNNAPRCTRTTWPIPLLVCADRHGPAGGAPATTPRHHCTQRFSVPTPLKRSRHCVWKVRLDSPFAGRPLVASDVGALQPRFTPRRLAVPLSRV